MKRRCMMMAVVVAVGLSTAVGGTLLVYEGFDYGTETSLDGRNGGQGFSNAWNMVSGAMGLSGDNVSLNSAAFLFNPKGSRLSHAATAVARRTLGSEAHMDFSLDGVFYMSALLLKSQTHEANEYIQVRFHDNGGTLGPPTFGFSSDDKFVAGQKTAGTVLPQTAYFFVVKVVTRAGAAQLDEIFLKVYGPDDTVDAAEPAEWTVTDSVAGSNIKLTQVRVATGANGAMELDEFHMGTTWASVAIPAPGSAAILFWAAALLAAGRRFAANDPLRGGKAVQRQQTS